MFIALRTKPGEFILDIGYVHPTSFPQHYPQRAPNISFHISCVNTAAQEVIYQKNPLTQSYIQ